MSEIIKVATLIFISFLIAIAGSIGGYKINETPIIFHCLLIAFGLQYLIFIPSYIFKSERFFDITGSVTFLSIIYYILYNRSIESLNYSGLLLISFITLWTLRLGLFLFFRIHKDGNDRRFDTIKTNFFKFMLTWTLQGTWVFITASCSISALSSNIIYDNSFFILLGSAFWLIGFILEVMSDMQKRKFKKNNKNGFITSGLWAYSRHPNYLGEIILWVGICIISIPSLQNAQFITLISPLFVYLLLTRISGINLLEEYADNKWGELESYQEYKKSTPILFPFKK